jgi:RNA polymerase sigma-70 factor (ECF subfamily)
LTQAEDAQDVRRILQGDISAFEGIVRRWQRPLVNLAWRCCRQREEAEDLAQECFLKIYRSLASWRASSAFSTWMFAVAINHCRSRLRGIPPDLCGLEAAFALPDPHTPAAELEGDARVDALRRAVVGLPVHYREAIVWHYFREKDVNSAAEILGIAEGTLKARLARARALLAKALAPRRAHESIPKET